MPPGSSAAPWSPAPSLPLDRQAMWCTQATPIRFTDRAAIGRPSRSTMVRAGSSAIGGSRCRSAPAMFHHRRPAMQDLRRLLHRRRNNQLTGCPFLERKAPPERGRGHILFCRCSLFDRRFFGGLFALSIGFVQEPIDETRTARLLDLSLLRFLLFGEKLVISFPAHWVLHQ